MENSKWIPGYEGVYRIYPDGRVYNECFGHFLKPGLNKRGYQRTILWLDGKANHVTVHRPEPGKQARCKSFGLGQVEQQQLELGMGNTKRKYAPCF